ncbi:MAG: EAL domain-containing protein [Gallionella sp.]
MINIIRNSSTILPLQMQQVFSASKAALVTSTVLAVVLAIMQRQVISDTVIAIWLFAVVLAAFGRAVLVAGYVKSPTEDFSMAQSRALRFRSSVLIAGIVWGSAGFLLFPDGDPEHQMFLIFMMAGLTAGSVVSYSADLVCAIGFSVTTLLPLITRLLIGGGVSPAMGFATLIYLCFMIMVMLQTNKRIAENNLLRNEAIAGGEAIRSSEERYRLLLSHSPVGIIHYDNNLVITYCNSRFADILHNTVERLIGLEMKTLEDHAIFPALRKPLSGATGFYTGKYHSTLNEFSVWIEMTCAPSRDGNGRIVGGVAIVQDISERRDGEEILRSRTGELELHNHTLSQINQHVPLSNVLDNLAKQIEVLHREMICSILLLDRDGKTLRHGAAPGLPDAYNQAISGLVIGDGLGSCGTAAFRGERVIVEDVREHPYWEKYRDLAHMAGVQSCWSQPIKDQNGKVLGTFAIYHRQPSIPSKDEILLIERYANLVQIAIESYQAQNDLRISATAFESQEGVLITDANSVILRVNKAFTDVTGYTADEVVGKNPRILSSGRQDANFYAGMWNSINSTGTWEGEVWNRRKNGQVFPEQLTIAAVRNAEGVITNYVASLTDITSRKEAEEEIRHLAFYDSLTKLPNRRMLVDRLQHALASSGRSGKIGALLFLDLDNFKALNDTLGHDVGDLLLQQVAARLSACVREGDTVARLGGDEFVVILEELSQDKFEAAERTEVVAEKLFASLRQTYHLAKYESRSTPSIGATLFGDHLQSTDELMKQADIAMYQSKKAGRNTLRFFDPEMQNTLNSRAVIEGDLHRALELGQLHLYYQIQMDNLNAPIGTEVLIRWLHPEQGLVSPAKFIPLAEETGLILPIGHWVLDTACAQISSWQDNAKTRDLVIAVNVSAKQFHQREFVGEVRSALSQHAVRPELLKLELTESMLLDNIEGTIATMVELKKLGVQFSLDDFGTGYSSLQYLKRLPLDQLKIDQSFVHDIEFDSSDRAIVGTIIAMAHSLNLDVIAEGVETEQQRQLLLDMGCTHFQGYLFGKPVPLQQFEVLFA